MIHYKKNRSKQDRPLVRPEVTPIDWLLEALALIGLLAFLGVMAFYFSKLPETIPSHFDSAGNPDGFESKSSIWVLTGVSLFIYILMSFINLIPQRFNFPVKITPQNALRQYTLAMRMIRSLKVVLIWMFFYINLTTIRVSMHTASGLGVWFLPVSMGMVFGPIIVYMVFAMKKS
ncbi:MAG: DUF1648 domain-containing protein [Bacteroidota bacterium]